MLRRSFFAAVLGWLGLARAALAGSKRVSGARMVRSKTIHNLADKTVWTEMEFDDGRVVTTLAEVPYRPVTVEAPTEFKRIQYDDSREPSISLHSVHGEIRDFYVFLPVINDLGQEDLMHCAVYAVIRPGGLFKWTTLRPDAFCGPDTDRDVDRRINDLSDIQDPGLPGSSSG